jgi:uncharacterized protein
MQVHYLEIVTRDVDAICAAYAAANGVQFGEPDAGLGGARTAALLGGGLVGVRQPLHATEEPVVRPYWLVDDVGAAVAAAVEAGADRGYGTICPSWITTTPSSVRVGAFMIRS